MKAKCYYCNKELTEKTIKRHMKNCIEMKKSIDEKKLNDKKQRNQFIIAIKPKYDGNQYCIYLSISGMLGLVNIDQFIRDIWVECCGHLSGFKIRDKYYQDNEMNTQLNDILNIDEKFEYEYDFGSTTHLILEVIDIIQVPSVFSQIEIIARNDEVKHEFDYCNSPRDGICGYEGNKENENTYLPGNDKKYKISEKKIKKQDDYEGMFNFEEDIFKDLSNVEGGIDQLINKSRKIIKNVFNNGIYSFDIKELISSLSKDNIYDIAKYLGMTKISSLNKNKLIEKFLYEYELLIEERMLLFDEERYKFLKRYSDNNGVKIFEEIKEDLEKTGYFLQNGMLFSASKDGELVILMPTVVQKLVKEKNNIQYRNMIKVNSEIVNLYRGMNNAYGLLKFKDIKELFRRYDIEESEKYKIEAVINNAEDYYREYEIQGIFYINCYIDNWVELLKEIELEIDVKYTMISKEELLGMSGSNYIYKSEHGKTVIREFLSMFDMEQYILEGLIESLYLEIQENELEEVINEILEQLDGDNIEIKEFMCNSVGIFLRDIRLWKYKGATINERKGVEINNEEQKSVGRNEKCPCRSGKKYKNCCAKDGNVIKLF